MDLKIVQNAFVDELEKISVDLTTEAREHIKTKNFALSAKQSDTGKPAYPIHDKSHAANALARVKQHGSPAERAEVYKDVAKKYPELASRSDVPAVRAKAKHASPLNELREILGVGGKYAFDRAAALEALKSEAGPALGAIGGAGLAAGLGKSPLSGAALGYGAGSLPEILLGKKHVSKG